MEFLYFYYLKDYLMMHSILYDTYNIFSWSTNYSGSVQFSLLATIYAVSSEIPYCTPPPPPRQKGVGAQHAHTKSSSPQSLDCGSVASTMCTNHSGVATLLMSKLVNVYML